ncbi:NlpC/P60 family protein [Cytobacillus purgationiresistens]|uniref:Peptidoglycan hydrolase CwlO-like protein/cell wall-associated NlpC family hydrolase n=1 Tax=Cytobacillus purgationiresistens TaxID=863449 RepID=A0ABU0ARR1_9BACI|nr:NlpC/P60 family protein [Cytobacillus purgationiresistens]MDQ0273487.1 peptidoglycan hydrolase CwlO-like protein/cell wall-associated NlpC family hydrolase [Cytobacillus purgationiresistens]
MKKKTLILTCSIIAISCSNVYAETNSIQDQISNVQEDLSKLEKDNEEMNNKQYDLYSQISKLDEAIAENEDKYSITNSRISQIQGEIKELQDEILKIEQGMELRYEVLKERAKSLQELSDQPWYLDVLFGSTGLSDFFSRVEAMVTISKADKGLLDQQGEDKKLIQQKKVGLDKTLAHLKNIEDELNEISNIVENQKKQKKEMISYLKYKEEQNLTEIRHLEQKKSMLKDQEERERHAIEFTSPLMSSQVPEEYMSFYLTAEKKYGIPWNILAAIHSIETNFSTHPSMVSSMGALGHMQFMPATFESFGVDADNDGVADPFSLADSIETAARYLYKHNFLNDPSKAIWHYNRADWYVNKVIQTSEMLVAAPSNLSGANDVTTIGQQWIGNTVYIFGGGRNQSDISNGRFDCSSFVHWVFNQSGIKLGELTSVTTDTLKVLGYQVSVNEMMPGDLVFFDTYKKDGHVGIYLGNDKFIGAQSSTGVAVETMTSGYWKEKFNQRVVRIKN